MLVPGAVGIEMAAEAKLVNPSQTVKLIHSRAKLLSAEPLPDDFKDRSLKALQDAGVEVLLDERVIESTAVEPDLYKLTLKDGSTLLAGHVIWAISHSVPTSTYLPSSALDKDGYIKISGT
jgi:NADH dehydrogenase FAD-containing subunit